LTAGSAESIGQNTDSSLQFFSRTPSADRVDFILSRERDSQFVIWVLSVVQMKAYIYMYM